MKITFETNIPPPKPVDHRFQTHTLHLLKYVRTVEISIRLINYKTIERQTHGDVQTSMSHSHNNRSG